MRLKRLLFTLLAPTLAIAVYGCADTDTPDVEYEANRPIYEEGTEVTEDPAAPGATTEWDEEDLNATDPTAPATDTTTPPADPAQPDAGETTTSETPETGTTPETPEAGTTPETPEGPAAEDVEEEPAADLPEEAENQADSEDQP